MPRQAKWKHLLTAGISIVLLVSANSVTQAKEKPLKFDPVLDLGVETTQAFLQDHDGFLWIGTAGGGLFRYDGYDLKNYGVGPGQLLTGNVKKIVTDQENPDMLWLVTPPGTFTRFDKATDTFTHYTYQENVPDGLAARAVSDIIQDRRNPNLLWVLGDGLLQQFAKDKQKFLPNKLDPKRANIPEHREFFRVLDDRENPNILWLAGFGLAKFDKSTEQFTVYLHDPNSPNGLGFETNYIGALTQDRDDPGILWLGYWDGAGLDKFDKRTEIFTHYTHTPDNPQSLRAGSVQLIADDGAGTLWLGGWADSNGLTAFDKQTETFTTYRHNPAAPTSVSTDTIVNVVKDKSGILWIVNMSGKIDKYDPYTQNFALYQSHPNTPNSLVNNAVYTIFEDRDGFLWFGTTGGLSKFDKHTGTFTNYTHKPDDPDTLDTDYILCTYQDSADDFWVGLYASPLAKVDRETGRVLERIPLPEGSGIAEIVEDPDNPDILWLGGVYIGFAKFQKASHTLTYYPFNPEHREKGVSGSDITEALHDRREPIIWLGSWSGGGLNKFDKRTETFTHYLSRPDDPQSLSYNEIGGLYQDASGTLWIGTRGGGLNKFNPITGKFIRYGQAHGVPATVNAILEDESEHLWLSTNQGIVRFNPKTERVDKQYTTYDGLQGDAFLYESGLKTRAGEMWFGGTNGVNSFYPDQLIKNRYVPPVVLTALTRGGETVNWDNNKVSERLDHITLTWKNNFFEFQYAALNYTIPEKNQYKYRLQGLDQDWYAAGTERTGRYSGIPSGTYTLQIIGANNDGVWNEQGVSLNVTVIPPFWATWWFRALIVVVFVGSGVATHFVRLRALEKQKQTLERLVKERTEELYQAKKRAEEAMYETERRFRVIFNQTFQFIGLAKPDGTIRELNQTTLEFFHVQDSQVVGISLWESPWFDQPEERAKIREAVRKAAEGEFVRFETSALAPDGARMVLDFSMKPLWGEFNNIYLLILEGRDLTDYRRTEEALRETLTAKERIESELRIAHDIQMEIIPRTFPPFPDRSEFDIYAVLESAKEVGGDLYDFFFIGEHHLCFVIGDVSDKGVPAALFMSAAKTLIKAIATQMFLGQRERAQAIPSTDAILGAVNYELSVENSSCMFVTVFCGILDVRTGEVCYTNAGHNPPLLLRQEGDVTFLDEQKCSLIGVDEDASFSQAMFTLYQGDTLFMYTDGITEAMNSRRELFSEERLQQEVSLCQERSAEALVQTILTSVRAFAGDTPQSDDMTMLVLTYLHPTPGETT